MPDTFVEVILPVKLDWNPVYRVPDTGVFPKIGDRVRVRLQGKELVGTISATDVTPDMEASRIRDIIRIEKGLEPVTAEEIRLWEFMSEYYMCTTGEVFKCAYPVGKVRSEETAARVKARSEAVEARRKEESIHKLEERILRLSTRLASKEESLRGKHNESVRTRLEAERDAILQTLASTHSALAELKHRPEGTVFNSPEAERLEAEDKTPSPELGRIMDALNTRKPALLRDIDRQETYLKLEKAILAEGKDILHIVPEIGLTSALEGRMRQEFGECVLIYNSHETAARKREIAECLRTPSRDRHYVVLGTRSAIFLPFRELGLVIIDEEQDKTYKQDSPAPRYQARDTAIVLARIHGAATLLGSCTPSLETIHNCMVGKYLDLGQADKTYGEITVIDTAAERKKRGMSGQFSRKLLDAMSETLANGGKVLLLRGWGDITATEEEVRHLFPEVPDGMITVSTVSQARHTDIGEGSLVALLQADTLLGSGDFRADERAMHVFDRFISNCKGGSFFIQTSRSAHELLKEETILDMSYRYSWLLSERRNFGYPLFSHIVDVIVRDDNRSRLAKLSEALAKDISSCLVSGQVIGGPVQVQGPLDVNEAKVIRIIIKNDGLLQGRKRKLAQCVENFEKTRKYFSHIHFDVDPE